LPDGQQIKELVMDKRAQLPKLGGRKLYHLISDDLQKAGIKMGRDKLFEFLRNERLLVAKRKKYHKTTDSKHWMRKYPNRIKDTVIERPEQVWVADITYLLCEGCHCYLHLVTDAYSKKIMGFELADNMQGETTLKALKMAIEARRYTDELTHHSDRGLQYCSKDYISELNKHNIGISMTEQSDPYENAVAERINGILKEEFALDLHFEDWESMSYHVAESISLYNQVRPHFSIELMTPEQAHRQKKIKLKKWKKKTHTEYTSTGL
jgi:transposase InsO family protein